MNRLNGESRSWQLQIFSRRWRNTMLRSTAICSWTWWVMMIHSISMHFHVKECFPSVWRFYFSPQNKDGSYTGFIKVQFKLARPVSVPPPKKGSHDAGAKKASGVKRRTSFYLPKDASKHLHISSRTSAREVIEALLKKFTVVDNPGKFALFERSERHDQGVIPIQAFNSRSVILWWWKFVLCILKFFACLF